jgi:hypothetical protein
VYPLSSYASSVQDLNNQERFYIAKYRAMDRERGYNMTEGGDGGGPRNRGKSSPLSGGKTWGWPTKENHKPLVI